MKKIVCIFLFVSILALGINIPALATSENLLKNPGFESGKTSWSCSTDTFTVVTDAHSGSYALKVNKDNKRGWFSLHQFAQDAMNIAGSGIYSASCYIKGTVGAKVYLTIKFIDNNNYATYAQASVITLTSSYQYTELKFSYSVGAYKTIDYYFYTGVNEACEITVDDCSLSLFASSENLPKPNKNIVRQSETQIGAIRWDAYFATSASPTSYSVSDQVARTLSYYQDQAPYYVEKSNGQYDVKLKFTSAYTKYGTTYTIDDVSSDTLQEKTIKYNYGTPWETEAEYAYNASLDYFAYLWYKTTDNMSLPRKAHVAKNGYINETDQLKMCGILEFGHFGKAVDLTGKTDAEKLSAISVNHKELYQAMASTCYLKVKCLTGDMPLLYLYNATNFISTDEANKINEEAKFYTAYLASVNPQKYTAINDVYFVAMTSQNVSKHTVDVFRYYGFDAISSYALSINVANEENPDTENVYSEVLTRYEYKDLTCSNGRTDTCYSVDYSKLCALNAKYKSNYEDLADKISSIPNATAGWTCVPRIKTGVAWCSDYGFQYVKKGTAEEIAENVRQNLIWLSNNQDSNKVNNLLIYAWNEHDEGGYICPTAKVDKNNQIIFNSNGEAEADTSVLDAVAKVIKEYKSGLNLKGDVNSDNRVNALDRIILSRHLAGWVGYSSINTTLSDIDSSNTVTILDRVILSRYIAGWCDKNIIDYFV